MTTVFPGGVDSLPRPSASTFTDDPGFELDVVIDNISDAVEAIETRLRQRQSDSIVNGELVASVGSNALTIAVKTDAGTDPSASNPVRFFFRDTAAGDGGVTAIDVTAALSLTISSGSTLGTANGVPFRLWVMAFNDGGTVRLGAMNVRSGTLVYWLAAWGIATTVAEGGAGGADNSQAFYTSTAVTLKAYAVLGYMTWETGLATAGTWSAVPTRIELVTAQTPLPGRNVQIQTNISGAVATGTTVIPNDDTIPQNTEGDEYMTLSVAPSSAANVLMIEFIGQFAASALTTFAIALFQDSTAGALASGIQTIPGANLSARLGISHVMLAGTGSVTTFKIRAGMAGAGTTTFNGAGGGRQHGGVLNSSMRVLEMMA